MKILAISGVLLIASAIPVATQTVGAGVVRPRSSLWKSIECEFDSLENGNFCSYLRFYSDGTVIEVTTLGNPDEIKRWFRRPYSRTGRYTLNGNRIRLSTTATEGMIEKEGVLKADTLRLNWFSHINKRSGVEEYRWVRPRPRHRQVSRRPKSPRRVRGL